MDARHTADCVLCRLMASSQYNRTTPASNHDCYRKQMVVISECANVGECSCGVQPNTTSPFRTLRQMTFMSDVSMRTSTMRSSLGENKGVTVAKREDTSERCLVAVCEEALNLVCNVRGKQLHWTTKDWLVQFRQQTNRPLRSVWRPLHKEHYSLSDLNRQLNTAENVRVYWLRCTFRLWECKM